MRTTKFLLTLIFLSSIVMSDVKKTDLGGKLLLISDATYDVTKNLPSLLLTSPSDSRIDDLAAEKKDFFLVNIQNKDENIVVIVNPNFYTGLLWWKEYSRLVLTSERWSKMTKNETQLTDDELKFFSKSEKFKFLLD